MDAEREYITVRIPVIKPTQAFPTIFIVSVVARADAARFTMLFPIKIADSIFSDLSKTRSVFFARLLPSSARSWSWMRLTVVSAVSDAEKKAEPAKRITSITICGRNYPTVIVHWPKPNENCIFFSTIYLFVNDNNVSHIIPNRVIHGLCNRCTR